MIFRRSLEGDGLTHASLALVVGLEVVHAEDVALVEVAFSEARPSRVGAATLVERRLRINHRRTHRVVTVDHVQPTHATWWTQNKHIVTMTMNAVDHVSSRLAWNFPFNVCCCCGGMGT